MSGTLVGGEGSAVGIANSTTRHSEKSQPFKGDWPKIALMVLVSAACSEDLRLNSALALNDPRYGQLFPPVCGTMSTRLRLYLDDQRSAPIGWVLAKTVDDAIEVLRQGEVTELSLDYDLGDPVCGDGLQLLKWLESAIAEGRVPMPRMTAHSGSVLGRRRLEAQIDWLEQRFGR